MTPGAGQISFDLATEADLDALVELHGLSFRNPWTREMFAQELRQPLLSRIFVVRLGTAVAGVCVCWYVDDEIHINTLAVHPQHRRVGLARRLLQHVLGDAATRGATRATLDVRVSNAAAFALYRGLGFTHAATRRDYYTNPVESACILWHERVQAFLGTGCA